MLWKIKTKLGKDKNKLRKYALKIMKILRTANLGSNFTGSFFKKTFNNKPKNNKPKFNLINQK